MSLKEKYIKDVKPYLMKKFGYRNEMEVPRLVKVTLNRGLGEALQNARAIEVTMKEFEIIAKQKPVVRRAKKNIAAFKLRKGAPIGVSVTLRKDRMWEFVEHLIKEVLPRVRDFRGLNPRSFDGRGNYNFGLKEDLVFPEISYDMIDKTRGLSISITTTARTDEEAFELLKALGFPFMER
ncbi:50S ribosomal protein L5 [Coprothermobacteraceae bacterium]|nr:50S ribosomal protein L5 [Coprothermobacteraceae bacterium]